MTSVAAHRRRGSSTRPSSPADAVDNGPAGEPGGREAPLLDLRVAADDGSPVYRQLVDQLRLLVETGELAPGTRLPSARHLAANLRINRNTALKAYLALAREGLLEGRRGGGTVVIGPDPDRPDAKIRMPDPVSELVKRLVATAMELMVPIADVLSLVSDQAEGRADRSRLKVGFVECNPESLGYFVARLREEFGVTVVPIFIRDLAGSAVNGELRDLDCFVSTFFHLSEVRRLLRESATDAELFAIAVRPLLSVLEALERLPRRSSVGVVYYERAGDSFAADRLGRMADAVRHAGVADVLVRPVLLKAPPSPGEVAGLSAVVVRPENVAPIRDAFPRTIPIIEFVNDLDTASLQFLSEVFSDFASRRAGRSRSSAAVT